MSRQTEQVLNARLGRLLVARNPTWTRDSVQVESTGTIRGFPALRIDILVESPGHQPIAIEAKFESPDVGRQLRTQIDERIGLTVDRSGAEIEAAIAVVYPEGLTDEALPDATLYFAIHQLGRDDTIIRWPEGDEHWLAGSIEEIANALEVVGLSDKRVRRGQDILEEGIRDASAALNGASTAPLGAVLHQESGTQTTRMAVAIIVNAFVFHYALEGQADIPDVAQSREPGGFTKSLVLDSWARILAVNYWPIFSIAHEILESIQTRHANPLLDKANRIAEQLQAVGASTFHDMAARMFQTLIADRKFLATFYTLPESALLLAELCAARVDTDWSDPREASALRVADFACGTGALLSAAQNAMYRKLRRASVDDATLHQKFMEDVLLGTDIMPSAIHLTASMLSSAHPGGRYRESLVRVLPYGVDPELAKSRKMPADTAFIGALDLVGSEFSQPIFSGQTGLGHMMNIGGHGMAAGARITDGGAAFPVEHASFDLVIMNPPFTRPTNHESATVPVPSFAGFNTKEREQRAMSRSLRAHPAQFGSGNAGLASNFLDLAHVKLKPGGTLGLVLPFSFVAGQSWSVARDRLEHHYDDILVVSIATEGSTDRAFSADTGMAECLLVATKKKRPSSGRSAVCFANIRCRPQTLVESMELARNILDGSSSRPTRLSQQPPRRFTRKRLQIGDPSFGYSVSGTFANAGVAGIRDKVVARSVSRLQSGFLDLPRQVQPHHLPLAPLGSLAERGVVDRDINGAGARGPFDICEWVGDGIPTYPALWSHSANRERQFVVQPDSEGVVRNDTSEDRRRAAELWNRTSSRLHHNRDFRLNSQSLALCLTPAPSLGGRAWPNLRPHQEEHTIPLLLWGNSTLGLILFWWNGTRQQQGRTILTIKRIAALPVLDVSRINADQLRKCNRLFERLAKQQFLPANEAYRDNVRKDLDQALFQILDFPADFLTPLDVLRLKWCAEPSVHGGKSTRPQTT